jgi:heptosyltransferase-1
MTIARALMVQLARLGDLLQSVPAIASLTDRSPETMLDLLCPAPLATIGRLLPGIHDVLPWDGADWARRAAQAAPAVREAHLEEAARCLASLAPYRYERAYVLNQHPRALLAAALLAQETIGPRVEGPLDERLTPWAAYIRDVAGRRRSNRVHLADAFCGLCGVSPPGVAPRLAVPLVDLPRDIEQFTQVSGLRLAVVVGAGDPARVVPPSIWAQWITALARICPEWAVVLVGTAGECEAAWWIHDRLSPVVASRVWNATGRTTLGQLAYVLGQCHWVVGADTGPLHLGTAVGARAMGFYLARARVHETGPYGSSHWVWQAEPSRPVPSWPVDKSVELVVIGSCASVPAGWSLWRSQHDAWGVFFTEAGAPAEPDPIRAEVWRRLG